MLGNPKRTHSSHFKYKIQIPSLLLWVPPSFFVTSSLNWETVDVHGELSEVAADPWPVHKTKCIFVLIQLMKRYLEYKNRVNLWSKQVENTISTQMQHCDQWFDLKSKPYFSTELFKPVIFFFSSCCTVLCHTLVEAKVAEALPQQIVLLLAKKFGFLLALHVQAQRFTQLCLDDTQLYMHRHSWEDKITAHCRNKKLNISCYCTSSSRLLLSSNSLCCSYNATDAGSEGRVFASGMASFTPGWPGPAACCRLCREVMGGRKHVLGQREIGGNSLHHIEISFLSRKDNLTQTVVTYSILVPSQ